MKFMSADVKMRLPCETLFILDGTNDGITWARRELWRSCGQPPEQNNYRSEVRSGYCGLD